MTVMPLSSFQMCLCVGIAQNDFWGGGCTLKCRGWCTFGHGSQWWQWCCCIAETMVTTTTMSSLSPMALAIALGVIVSGRQQRWVPIWLLPGCCLYLLLSSSFLLLSSTPHPFLPISLLQACIKQVCIEQVVNSAFGLTQGRWWWWIGWTNQHHAWISQWQCDTR
jgi:hypothetical protein